MGGLPRKVGNGVSQSRLALARRVLAGLSPVISYLKGSISLPTGKMRRPARYRAPHFFITCHHIQWYVGDILATGNARGARAGAGRRWPSTEAWSTNELTAWCRAAFGALNAFYEALCVV